MNTLASKWQVFWRANRVGVLLLVAVWLIFFSPLLSGRYVYFLDDLKIIYYPLEHAYAQSQAMGELPVWSTTFGFGQPLVAWGQLGFFTPLHFVLRLLHVHPLWLLQVSVVGYYGLGLAGMYLFLRRRVDSVPAALGSALYVFSGFHIGHLNHVNFYVATMWLPWLLLALDNLITKPTLRRCGLVAAVAGAMLLSGQPQIVLYSAIAAVVISLALMAERIDQRLLAWRQFGKIVAASIAALALAVCLSAFSLLPLFEFVPDTERGDALPISELYEFSYPPVHAVTLLLPYFFGDHEQYWGAKGFQELAGFVGIIPLLLAGLALTPSRRLFSFRLAGSLLLLGSFCLMLGRYSPLYYWLVEQHILTTLAVPGRFIFFFDVAIVLLAAAGLSDLQHLSELSKSQRVAAFLRSVGFVAILLAPFFRQLASDTRLYERGLEYAEAWHGHLLAALLGLFLFIGIFVWHSRLRQSQRPAVLLAAISVGTLLVLGWNYNPRTPRAQAFTTSPFAAELAAFKQRTGLPARLYSAENILSKLPPGIPVRATEPVSRKFTVHQAIKVRKEGLSCLSLPYSRREQNYGIVEVSLRDSIDALPLDTYQLTGKELSSNGPLQVCFPQLQQPANIGRTFIISFASQTESPLQLLYADYEGDEENAYFVRKENPTAEQLAASRKPVQLVFTPSYPPTGDMESLLLARHLNVTTDTSSARWIGALSVHDYRGFIEYFFANDTEAIDGDGVHALVRYRDILNMAGVTHLAQAVPHGHVDTLVAAGFVQVASYDYGPKELRLYENPDALPKAFFVQTPVYQPVAEETRHALRFDPYSPQGIAYIDGPAPPARLSTLSSEQLPQTQAAITRYTTREVEVAVNTPSEAFLVLTDTTTPQWRTYIDGRPAPQYRANSVFKSAQVPAGEHTVTFRYESPAIARAKMLTLLGIFGLVILLLPYSLLKKRDKS